MSGAGRLTLAVVALAALEAGCGGPTRYVLLADLDRDLGKQYGRSERLNAFYCSDQQRCVPNREAFRVPWTIVCGATLEAPCSPGLKKYQDVFDGTAKLSAILKQIRFTAEGVSKGTYRQDEVAPILAFAAKTVPGVLVNARKLVDALRRLNPKDDLKTSPLEAAKVASALPSTASSLASVIDEVGTIAQALSKLGVATMGRDGGGQLDAAEDLASNVETRPGRTATSGQTASGRPTVGIVVARGAGVDDMLTRGLAVKVGVEVRRRGLGEIAPIGLVAAQVPPEDDPFYVACVDNDVCLLAIADELGCDAALLLVAERQAGGSLGVRLGLAEARTRAVRRGAPRLPEGNVRAVPGLAATLLGEALEAAAAR